MACHLTPPPFLSLSPTISLPLLSLFIASSSRSSQKFGRWPSPSPTPLPIEIARLKNPRVRLHSLLTLRRQRRRVACEQCYGLSSWISLPSSLLSNQSRCQQLSLVDVAGSVQKTDSHRRMATTFLKTVDSLTNTSKRASKFC